MMYESESLIVQCFWFLLRSRELLYSAGSGVNRVQVVLSGYSVTG